MLSALGCVLPRILSEQRLLPAGPSGSRPAPQIFRSGGLDYLAHSLVRGPSLAILGVQVGSCFPPCSALRKRLVHTRQRPLSEEMADDRSVFPFLQCFRRVDLLRLCCFASCSQPLQMAAQLTATYLSCTLELFLGHNCS
jgi:hypothetical protein